MRIECAGGLIRELLPLTERNELASDPSSKQYEPHFCAGRGAGNLPWALSYVTVSRVCTLPLGWLLVVARNRRADTLG
jgi:hypothetical protein